jgi:hypothetical protein
MNGKASDWWNFGCDVKGEDPVRRFGWWKISTAEIVVEFVNNGIRDRVIFEVKFSLIRAFKEVFIEVRKHVDRQTDIDVNMAIHIQQKARHMRDHPAILFFSTSEVNTTLRINRGPFSDRMGKAVLAMTAFIAARVLPSEMIPTVHIGPQNDRT